MTLERTLVITGHLILASGIILTATGTAFLALGGDTLIGIFAIITGISSTSSVAIRLLDKP